MQARQGSATKKGLLEMKKTFLLLALGLFMFGCSPDPVAETASDDALPEPIGQMPEFNLVVADGSSMASEDLKGKVIVADLWATWCAPCIKEIPMFNELHSKYEGSPDVKVIAITVESGKMDEIKPYVDKFQMTYPVAEGTDEVAEGFGGILGYPTTFIIGKDGKIYKNILGANKDKKAIIEKLVENLRENAS
jgi:thiol-disulfide isomerase/thioredoxin